MYKLFYILLYTLICFFAKAQLNTTLLQNFANPALFNLTDTQCPNISGEWLGEEVEYLDDFKNEKGKYNIRFNLIQQGNKVSGTSYITFDNGKSYGLLKIRGLVADNKLYFEEYEVLDQKFINPGIVWCLRTGELDLGITGETASLGGNNYKGYAAYFYTACNGAVKMNLTKTMSASQAQSLTKNNPGKDDVSMQLHPNPANNEVTITFKIPVDMQVRVEMYNLSGELMSNITNDFFKAGTYQQLILLNQFSAGAYIMRMQAGNQVYTKTLVIAR